MNTNDSLTTKFSNVSAGGIIAIGAYFSSVAHTTENVAIGGGLALIGVSSLITNRIIEQSNYKPGLALASVALVSALTFGTDEVARKNFTCGLTNNCIQQDTIHSIPKNRFQ